MNHRECVEHVDNSGVPGACDCPCRTEAELPRLACAFAGCGFCLAASNLPPVPAHVRSVYRTPFKHDGMFGGIYVFDADQHTVGDLMFKAFQARGWGRFKYMPNGEQIHDDLEAYFTTFIDPKDNADVVVAKLNAAWGG